MHSVGERLRSARLEQGLDLAAVAALTKINAKYLQAIEADDRHNLPSSFFYKSFVHQYAKILGLNPTPILEEIDGLLSADAPLPLPGQESPVSRYVPPMPVAGRFHHMRTLASSFALLVVVLACSGIYAWWRQSRTPSMAVQPRTAAVPAGTAAVVRTPAEMEKPAPPQEPAAVASQAPMQQAFTALPGYKVLLDLIAREETWLSISSDGRRIFSGTLAANQTKTVEGKEFAKLKVGNAAGLEVRLNGKFLGPLGGRGQVLTVLFTPDNFQILVPLKEGDD